MKIKLDLGAFMPQRVHKTDAGLDIKAPRVEFVPPMSSIIIDTGVHIQLPKGTVGLIKSKSGLNMKHNIVSAGGVIDEGYTGSIKVKLYNHGDKGYRIDRGDKITQLLVIPCQYPAIELENELSSTERGDNGLGSTGK